MSRSLSVWAILAACLLVAQAPLFAAEAADGEVQPKVEVKMVFDSLLVTGGAESVELIPGSASFLGPEELAEQDYSDIHRALRLVPGVNLQEEDGYGLRPNIGMRGSGVERSSKITLLEDGVLVAPAPYAAPSAYYVPTAGRMEAVEVRKGSASIGQGPYTNGGVINLVSAGIPDELAADIKLAYGDNQTLRLNGLIGGSGDRLGWLLQTYRFDTEGFKDLDGGGSTGVELEDYVGKLRFGNRTDAKVYQAAELKVGRTDQLGDETYLGLTEADFGRTPFRRYAASQQDYIDTEHEQYQLRYYLQPSSRFRLTATAYRNDFYRNWHKGQSVAGLGLSSVLDNPDVYPAELALLRGEIDDLTGALMIRNNRRDYFGEGLDVMAQVDLSFGNADHGLEFGLRRHSDQEDRFQEEDSWNMVDGRLVGEVRGVPGSQSNRVSSADATAFYIRDEIRMGRWSLVPGVRFESIDFEREDYGKSDPSRAGSDLSIHQNDTNEVLPGIGVSYQIGDSWSAFGGVHKGFAPPGPGQSPEVENEESVNYEAGFNFQDRQLTTRVVGFFNDYENLLGRDTLSGGGDGTGDAFNGGEVEVFGLEASLGYDFGRSTTGSASIPVRLIYTYTGTEFGSSFETSFADWAPEVTARDELPYIPEQQATVTAGYIRGRWAGHLSVSYTSDARTTPGQGAIAAGTEIESRLITDLSVNFELLKNLRLFAQVRNLADVTYLAARRPHGARPGLPRATLVGVEWNFGR